MRLPFSPIPRAYSGDEERTAEALRLHEEALRAWVRRWINDIYPWPEDWIRLGDPAGPFDSTTAWGRPGPGSLEEDLAPGATPAVPSAGPSDALPFQGENAESADAARPSRHAVLWTADAETGFERLEAATPDISPLSATPHPALHHASPRHPIAQADSCLPESGSGTCRLWLRKVPLWMPLAPQATGFAPVPILPGLLLPSPGPEWIPLEGAQDTFARPFAWRRGDTLALGWDPFHLTARSLLLLEEQPGSHPDDLPEDPPFPSWDQAWVDRQWDWIWELVAGSAPLPGLSRTVLPRLRPHLGARGDETGHAAIWITRERRFPGAADLPAPTEADSPPETVFAAPGFAAPPRSGLLASPGTLLDEAATARLATDQSRRNSHSKPAGDRLPGSPGAADDDPAPRLVRAEDGVFHAQRMPRNLSKAGFRIDSSASLGAHPGFRFGTARPFAWFDVWSGRVLALVEAAPSVVVSCPPPPPESRLGRFLGIHRSVQADREAILPDGGVAALDAVAQEVRHVRGLLVLSLPADAALPPAIHGWLAALRAEGWTTIGKPEHLPA